MSHSEISRSYLIAIFLIETLIFTFIIQSLFFFINIPVNIIVYPLSILLSGICISRLSTDIATTIQSLTYSLIIISISILLSTFLNDYSYDGNTYHQEIIAELMEGWNPYGHSFPEGCSIWLKHYPLCAELIAADIATLTGHIESGKAFNLILIISTTLLVFSFTSEFFRGIKTPGHIIIAVVALLNPICMSQMFTYYIDFTKYCYFLQLIIFIIHATYKFNGLNSFLIASIGILAVNTKFTFFFETGLLFLCAIIWLYFSNHKKASAKLVGIGIVVAIIGGLFFGYHPYITNYLTNEHPLYPILGKNSIDIMSYNIPASLAGLNRFEAFFKSLFSFRFDIIYDSRLGGMGPLMPLILALSVFSIIYCRKSLTSKVYSLLIFISLMAISFVFIYNECWWARYGSQLWIPVVAATLAISTSKGALSRFIQYATVILVITNSFSIIYLSISQSYYQYRVREYIYRHIGSNTVECISLHAGVTRHFKEHGIKAQEIQTDTNDKALYVNFFCKPSNFGATRVRIIEGDESLDSYLERTSPTNRIMNLFN